MLRSGTGRIKRADLGLGKDELAQRRTEHTDKVHQADRELNIRQGQLDELIRNNADKNKIDAAQVEINRARANAEIYRFYAEAFELRNRHRLTGRTDQMDLERVRRAAQIAAQTIRNAEAGATSEQTAKKIKEYLDLIEKETGIPMKSPTGGVPGTQQAPGMTGSPEPPPGAMIPPQAVSPTARPSPPPEGGPPLTTSGMPPELYGGAEMNQQGQWQFPPVPGMTPKYPDQVPVGAPQAGAPPSAQYGPAPPQGYDIEQGRAAQQSRLASSPNLLPGEKYPPEKMIAPDGSSGMMRNQPPAKIQELVKKGWKRVGEPKVPVNPGLQTSIVP